MRVTSSGNLTVELIRAQLFDCYAHTLDRHDHVHHDHARHHPVHHHHIHHHHAHHARDIYVVDCREPVDRVELSCGSLASDPWARAIQPAYSPTDRPMSVSHAVEPVPLEIEPEPEDITPVIGSPALSGLGAAWIVPGTLLDVVA